MTDKDWIQQQLNSYAETFDRYMDQGSIPSPPAEASSDPLRDYLQEVLSEPFNYFQCQEDPIWCDVFKSTLMTFFSAMLQMFLSLEKEQQHEKDFMLSFFNAGIDTKRQKWEGVVETIQNKYPVNELNPFGYLPLLQSVDESRYKPIFEAMHQQWIQVAEEHMQQEKHKLLSSNKQRFQNSIQTAGKKDYQTIFNSKEILVKYPILNEIMDLIGRQKSPNNEEKDTTITRYLPFLLSQSKAVEELDGVCLGNTIQQAIPSELVYLSEQDTEDVFFFRVATNQLQQMATKSPSTSQEKTEHKTTKKPRLTKGPIIVSMDTSGSMMGRPTKIANSLLLQLLQMARRQKRPCFLITYSVRAKAIDLAHPANWELVKQFLKEGFSGGTDGDEMLTVAINTLQSKTYSMADVLIISDFCWEQPDQNILQKMHDEQAKGTKFYGLSISNFDSPYTHSWLDKRWEIALPSPLHDIFL